MNQYNYNCNWVVFDWFAEMCVRYGSRSAWLRQFGRRASPRGGPARGDGRTLLHRRQTTSHILLLGSLTVSSLLKTLNSDLGHRSWPVGESWPPKICRRGQSVFWPPKMSPSFIQNCFWIILPSFSSSGMKDLCQNRKAKLINRGTLKSLMAWPWRHIYWLQQYSVLTYTAEYVCEWVSECVWYKLMCSTPLRSIYSL